MAAELQTPLSELLHTGHVRDPIYLVKRRFIGTPIPLRPEFLRLGRHRLLDTAGNGMPPAVSVGNLAMENCLAIAAAETYQPYQQECQRLALLKGALPAPVNHTSGSF
jgi:hypothetical protein